MSQMTSESLRRDPKNYDDSDNPTASIKLTG